MADETIQNLNIDISVDDKASSQIKSLEESIDSLLKKFETLDTKSDSVSKSLGDFGDTGKSLDNVASKIDKTAKSAEKLAKTDMSSNVKKQVSEVQQSISKLGTDKISAPDVKVDTKQVKNVSNAAKSAEQSTDKLGESAKKAAVDLNYLTSSYAKLDYLQKELNTSQQKLKELAQGGEGYENKTVRKLIDDINKYQKEINNINSERFKEIDNQIKSVGKNGKKNFKDLGKTAEQSFKKVDKGAKKSTKSTKKFGNGLRQLLNTAKQFLIFGAFFTIQRQISDAFGEGTQNLYQYSKAIGGDFANSMDRISTSFLYLKNSIGAAVAPIINYLTPALESLIDTVAELGNKIAEVMAALTGQKVYTKAVKSYKEYAEAADTAAEATNNALASFDEINNLSSNKGGTTDETSNYGSMFEEQEVNLGKGLLAQFVDNLRSGNWGEAGSILAQKVNGVVNSINESNIGQKLADKFNNALKFANGFLGTFDFGMFGTTLFTQITNFIEEIDWGEIGRIFSNLIVGALDFTQAFIKWIFDPETYKKIFNAIVEFINGIDWHKVGTEIIETVTTLFDSVADFTIEPSTWAKISNALVTGLKDLIKGAYEAVIKWAEGKSFKELALDVVKVIFKPFTLLYDAVYGLISGIFGGDGSTDKISGIDISKINKSKFATGGYPTTGQMFIARESGPELVGSIGGRTAVVNNDQIVQAVSMGVYNAVVDAFSTTSDNGNEQPVVVQIDGREVFRAVRSQNDSFRRRTGTSAF